VAGYRQGVFGEDMWLGWRVSAPARAPVFDGRRVGRARPCFSARTGGYVDYAAVLRYFPRGGARLPDLLDASFYARVRNREKKGCRRRPRISISTWPPWRWRCCAARPHPGWCWRRRSRGLLARRALPDRETRRLS